MSNVHGSMKAMYYAEELVFNQVRYFPKSKQRNSSFQWLRNFMSEKFIKRNNKKRETNMQTSH